METNFDLRRLRVGVVGLGYVGLPLAVELGKRYPTVGYDVDVERIRELGEGKDSSLEVAPEELKSAEQLSYTGNAEALADCNLFIVTVPTPINAHKAQAVGYHPEIILAGRRLNDSMGAYVVSRVIKLMTRRNLIAGDTRALVLGLAFKENCPDLRNTRVVDIVSELTDYGITADVYDPLVKPGEARDAYGITPIAEPRPGSYDAVIIAVAHRRFAQMGAARLRAFGRPGAVLFDVKHLLPASAVDGRL